MRTLASRGEFVLDVVLPQPLVPQTVANARIRIAPRMDAYYSSQSGYGNDGSNPTPQFTITVLDETKKIDGVETRVVEERETRAGSA